MITPGKPSCIKDRLRLLVRPRGVMGMEAMDRNAFGGGSRRTGERFPPAHVFKIAEFRPIKNAEHHGRGILLKKNHAISPEAVANGGCRRTPSAAKRMADGWGDVFVVVGDFHVALIFNRWSCLRKSPLQPDVSTVGCHHDVDAPG